MQKTTNSNTQQILWVCFTIFRDHVLKGNKNESKIV